MVKANNMFVSLLQRFFQTNLQVMENSLPYMYIHIYNVYSVYIYVHLSLHMFSEIYIVHVLYINIHVLYVIIYTCTCTIHKYTCTVCYYIYMYCMLLYIHVLYVIIYTCTVRNYIYMYMYYT